MKGLQCWPAAILLVWGFSPATWAQTTPPKAAPIRLKLPALSPTIPPISADPNTIVGLTVNTRGQPLENVRVVVHGVFGIDASGSTDTASSPLSLTPDANRSAWATAHGGSYETNSEVNGDQDGIKSQDQTRTWSMTLDPPSRGSQQISTDIGGHYAANVASGHYRVDATIRLVFDGATFDLPLCPVRPAHDIAVNDNRGAVENFVWRLSGLKPGADPNQTDSYYGAHLWLKSADMGKRAPSGRVEVVLLPTGPLVDWSAAAPLTFQCVLGDKAVCWNDIPLGHYTAQAALLLPHGQRQPLLTTSEAIVRAITATQESSPIHFRPTQDGTPEAALSIVAH